MEKTTPSSSSTSTLSTARTKAKANDAQMRFWGFDGMNEDLLHNILARLPAQSFASAACVSKSWNRICNRVLSRPKLASALSLKPSLPDALNEVFDKVLSEPIRPHFAIANVGIGFELSVTLKLIRKKLGCLVPIIVSAANGIIGRDALTDELKEVKWGALFSGFSDEAYARNIHEGIVMTIGFFPGLKVDAIPLVRPSKTPLESAIDKFVMDVKEYSASVSRCSFPVGILLFGEGSSDMKSVMEKLDYAMPKDTFIVGDERGCFTYRSGTDSRNAYARTGYLEAVALVFAQDRDNSSGEIKFHVALSNGVLPVGDKYKTASVRTSSTDSSTWLTARREGQREILDGQRLLNDINNELGNHIEPPDLYIGVFKQRKLSVGSEKPRQRTFISFHGVVGGDEEYLYVDGIGIKTGDIFQFYYSDCNAALASCTKVYDELKNIKLEANSKNLKGEVGNATNVFGGFIFACYGRGESFFGRVNVDSTPFSENFPGVPVSGIFCGGEMARSCSTFNGQFEGESSASCCLHVYSSVYLVMSYTPSVQY